MARYILTVVAICCLTTACVTESASSPGAVIHAAMAANPKVAAGQAHLDIMPTTNTNSLVVLTAHHLPNPARILPKTRFYVVWETPVGLGGAPRPQSLGALRIDKNWGSQLKTFTPFRSFDLFITAEPNAFATVPTGEKLFWSSVSR